MNTLPTTIDQVIEQLDQILIWSKENGNRLGYFPALYKRVTIEIKNKIAEKYFDDNERMEKLDVVFANRYIEAINEFRNGNKCTQSWQLAFDTTMRWPPLVIQHLFLGMNAHISLDLGIAAATAAGGDDIMLLRNDFMKINLVLGALVDDVQNQLSRMWPLLKPIDWAAGKLDEKLSKFAMGIARDAAWQVALDYSKLTSDEEKASYIENRDFAVANFGNKLANPGLLLSGIIRLMRFLEFGTVVKKIGYLDEEQFLDHT
jgi:hypothetical protein